MRKNLIVDTGIDLMMGQLVNTPDSNSTTNYGIPNIIRAAGYGSSATPALVTDTALVALIDYTTTSTQTCSYTFDTIDGYAEYSRVYDFSAVTGTTIVNEIGIFSFVPGSPAANMLSRVVLPSTVTLALGQFLRLTYSLRVSVPALVGSGSPIALASGTFDGSGQLKLVGKYQNIFGIMSSLGVPDYTKLDSDPAACAGWLMSGSIRRTVGGYLAAQMAPAGTVFPSVNTSISFTPVGTGAGLISSAAYSSGTVIGTYTANGQGYLDITNTFPATNPAASTNIGGILFRATSAATYASSTFKSGWFWKFNTTQLKEANNSLALNVRQTVSRV
jgi:hypothetical protein